MQPSMLAKRGWIFLLVVITAFYFWGLATLPLVGPDEPRYAEVAREMLARGDFITPTLGGQPWFEKPPLLYWLMMASFRLLSVNEYAARLGPALCGLLSAVFVYWIGKSVISQRASEAAEQATTPESASAPSGLARWSALALLSSVGVIAFSRAASFDIVMMMAVAGALACFFVWHIRNADRRAGEARAGMPLLLLGFYFFLGVSLLAKGLVGLVVGFGVIIVYFLLRREQPGRVFLMSLLWGIPFAAAIAGLWYGPMMYRHGWRFIDQFIVQHHFARFATNKYHHPGPLYFYLPVLAALALPWTIVLIAALISARRWNWRGETTLDRLRVFALAWILAPIIFFSFSGSKLTAYILPVIPAVALLVGERVTCFLGMQRGDKVIRLTGLMLIVLSLGGAWYATRHASVTLVTVAMAAIPLVLAGVIALLLPRLRTILFLLIPVATLAASAIIVGWILPTALKRESVRDLLIAAAARGYASTPVVQLHTVERTAEFYGPGRVSYGADGEPVKLEGVPQVEKAARLNGGVVLCFVPKEYESQLTSYQKIQTDEIANNGRVALVVVRAR